MFLMVRGRCGSGSQVFKKSVFNGPGPFWLREPVFQTLEKSVINGPGPFWLRELGFKEHCF